jgi:predicted nucleotidyltransferase
MKKEKKLLIKMLDKRSQIIFAYLFGSKVKGYANEMSDWDIAIFFKKPLKKINRWPAFELEAELSRVLRGTVQVIILNNPLPPVLAFEILKDGILLLDKDPNLRMDFENRMLRYYYDWQFFLKRQMEAERSSPNI